VVFLHKNDDDQSEVYMMCTVSYLLAQCMAFVQDLKNPRGGNEQNFHPCTSWQFIPSCVLASTSVAALVATHTELGQWYILSFSLGVAVLMAPYALWLRPILQSKNKLGFADLFVIKFLINISILLFMFIYLFASRSDHKDFSITAAAVTWILGLFTYCHITGTGVCMVQNISRFYHASRDASEGFEMQAEIARGPANTTVATAAG
jgi:hypothetical protein